MLNWPDLYSTFSLSEGLKIRDYLRVKAALGRAQIGVVAGSAWGANGEELIHSDLFQIIIHLVG